ncbi:hypothetical protein J4Q44_G00246270 [Coregonus suidteri]|uniref:Uncharacterized protein n=1 Tax=Coregonus suidteri TaxID=861788 RepID=A0AAN8LCS7_9TELE
MFLLVLTGWREERSQEQADRLLGNRKQETVHIRINRRSRRSQITSQWRAVIGGGLSVSPSRSQSDHQDSGSEQGLGLRMERENKHGVGHRIRTSPQPSPLET